jgi:hypothetical protein
MPLGVIFTASLFFTDCSFKDSGELSKVLMVHHQCNDTGNACITSVTDTGEACIAGINDTGRVVVLHWLVTMTLASHDS